MLDTAFAVLIVTLIVQGLKQLGFPVADTGAKVIALGVAAFFLLANGLIDLFVPIEVRPVVKSFVDAIKLLLAMFAPAGVYGYVKMLAASKILARSSLSKS